MLPKTTLSKSTNRKVLSENQENFLRLFWDSGCDGDPKQIALAAGYAESSVYLAVKSLENEILELTKLYLIQHAPKAARQIVDVMTSDEPIRGVKDKLLAATTVLDRVGIVKQDKMEVEHTHSGGVFLIPTKAPIDAVDAYYEEVIE
jgi:hypothetical protein